MYIDELIKKLTNIKNKHEKNMQVKIIDYACDLVFPLHMLNTFTITSVEYCDKRDAVIIQWVNEAKPFSNCNHPEKNIGRE